MIATIADDASPDGRMQFCYVTKCHGAALETRQNTVHLHTAMRHRINGIIRLLHSQHRGHVRGVSLVFFGQLDNGWVYTPFGKMQRPVCHSCLDICQTVLSS